MAGLTLAATLDPSRFDVTVHDDRRLLDVGTAYGMWPGAMLRLSQLGLSDKVIDVGVPCPDGEVRDRQGRLLIQLPPAQVHLIRRHDLLRLLEDAVPNTVARRYDHVTNVADLEDAEGSLVVAADGVRSALRARAWGTQCRNTGVTALRGVIDDDLSDGRLVEHWAPGAHFGTTPDPRGGTNWFATFHHRRFGDRTEALRFAADHFTRFPETVRAVLDRATAEPTLVNDILVSRRLGALHRGNVVLIGDAAHAMAPNLGRGACEAIIDAVVLGRELNRSTPRRAVAAYERNRLLPTQVARIAASAVQSLSLAGHGTRTRNIGLRVMSAAGARRGPQSQGQRDE